MHLLAPVLCGLLTMTLATDTGQTLFNLSASSTRTITTMSDFSFKEAPEIFSPHDLISLPRPGAGSATTAGDFVLVPVSEYDPSEKKNVKYLYIYAVQTDIIPLKIELTKGGQAFWLTNRQIGYVIPSPDDLATESSTILAWDVTHFPRKDGEVIKDVDMHSVEITTIPTSEPANFVYKGKSGRLVFSAYVWEDGKLENVNKNNEEYASRGHTGMVFDSTYERQWDSWKIPGKRPALFSLQMYQDFSFNWVVDADGRGFVNLQRSWETGHSTPVEPFGGTDNFAVSDHYVVYTTLSPEFKKEAAWHTRQDVFLADIKGEGFPRKLNSGNQGATASPVISSREDKIAWLEMSEDGYEADRNKIMIHDMRHDLTYCLTPTWDRSPSELAFGKSGFVLYFTAGDLARVKVFAIPIPRSPPSGNLPPKYTPISLTQTGAVSSIEPLYTGRLLFTRSTLTSPNDVWVIQGLPHLEEFLKEHPEDTVLSATFDDLVAQSQGNLGLRQITHFAANALEEKSMSPGEDFWFTGAEGKKIQGFVVKPPGFKPGEMKKWPVVLLIHGGPQSAWADQWSTRWNPQVFAGQGYVTVFMNPTGSTTFGQELTDAIAGDWGGKPFVDMQNGWKYILEAYPEIDPDRAVAAGASWGGYAINWIQGHPEFVFGFKAMVCHDGVFDARYNGFSTDELFFFNHEWGGRPWDSNAKDRLERMNPANFIEHWSTPQLIIHSSKDYRLPETDGIGAFHALQQRGVESRLLVFPDENHWVLKHGNSLKWHYEVFRWFDKFVGKE